MQYRTDGLTIDGNTMAYGAHIKVVRRAILTFKRKRINMVSQNAKITESTDHDTLVLK